eukprot:13288520-Alexandrium_andersonii.AAC.1
MDVSKRFTFTSLSKARDSSTQAAARSNSARRPMSQRVSRASTSVCPMPPQLSAPRPETGLS